MTDLTTEQTSIIAKVQKLMRLADSNPNEAEAASAASKAQALLVAYNLDMAQVGEVDAGSAKREREKLKGGAYRYQRWLWQNVAELNFCLYWCGRKWLHYKVKRKHFDGTSYEADWPRLQWHHNLVGRIVNVAATKAMASYLETSVERLLRERLRNKATGEVPHTELFSRWAVSYRTGAMNRVVEKIQERRDELLAEEHRKKTEAARNGVSTSNALTVAAYSQSEREANNDALYGEGWTAKQAAARAAQATADREAEEAYTAWAVAHPEEARKKEEEARKENEKYWARRRGGRKAKYNADNLDSGAYYAGYDAAEAVSIDQQVGGASEQRRIA